MSSSIITPVLFSMLMKLYSNMKFFPMDMQKREKRGDGIPKAWQFQKTCLKFASGKKMCDAIYFFFF